MINKKDNFSKQISSLIPRLRRYAIVLTTIKEDADDLLQATLERAINKQHQWQENTHLDRWAFTIMSSIWKNEIRSRSTRQGNGITDNVQALIDNAAIKNMEGTFLLNQVFKEVMNLSEDQREAILLVYVEGLKYQEAADILTIPTGTLMSRLARARITLANNLSDENQSSNVIEFKEHKG
ncbi:MAG: sigma-70 family RNA polymerase sigma factor [Cocleimonas sp.]|nr:sigma-70 family RNA polymerase sigma factor [Cocleimonas sp.]